MKLGNEKINKSRRGKNISNLRVMGWLYGWSCFSQSCLQASKLLPAFFSSMRIKEDGEDRVWTTGNKRGMSISGRASSLWLCCGIAPSGSIILYSTRPFEVSVWRWWHVTSGLVSTLQGQAKTPTKALQIQCSLTLSSPSGVPHPFPSCCSSSLSACLLP